MPSGRRWSRGWAVVAVCSALALTVLTVLVAVRWHPLISLDRHSDRSAHDALVSHRWLERASRDVTQFGDPRVVWLLTIAGAAAAATRRRWDLVVLVIAVRLVELGVNSAIKDLVERPRPHLANPVVRASGFSFPSGHAAGTTAVYAVLTLLFDRAGSKVAQRAAIGVVVVLIAAVAATRVLLGVHYPSDVTGGIIVGVWSLAIVKTFVPAR
jgi:undecaprenyl-diphosphatase